MCTTRNSEAMTARSSKLVAYVLLVALAALVPGVAAQEADEASELPEAEIATAPVEVDGRALFSLRGVSALPAEKRAASIAGRIRAVGEDASFDPEALELADQEGLLSIMAGDLRVMAVTEADARLEGVAAQELAQVYRTRIREALVDYRRERASEALLRTSATVLGVTAALALALLLVSWARRRLQRLLDRRLQDRVKTVGISSFELVRGERLWGVVKWLVGAVRTVTMLVLLYLYLTFVLGAYPWTRWMSARLGEWVVGPLLVMGRSALAEIPDLIFLAILFVVVRYVLRVVKLFFEAVAAGTVVFPNFDPEWSVPTYKIARLAVIGFGLVVAYPYVPGSGSAAFKGISLFAGVVFSLGSSSAIANTIAGYSLTYRRAFKVGDRIRVGSTLGDVTGIRLQVTHVRTPKNEDVVIPNSEILRQEVVNYSTLAASRGLLLHTTVGIGYETPWRQVEAMLLLAAERTPGLLQDPPPFVLHTALGDFCVTYELNVACSTPQAMARLYTDLHRNILDVFNEYGVQIMTPAYEGDTAQPKVVPREQWFLEPAAPPPVGTGDAMKV